MIELQPNLELSIDEAERVLGAWLDQSATCSEVRPLKGGMVNSVFSLEFDCAPHTAVIKLHTTDSDTFGAEATALRHLRRATDCPVPTVYQHDRSGTVINSAFLLLEYIDGVCLKNAELDAVDLTRIEVELAGVLGRLHAVEGPRFGSFSQVADSGSNDWSAVFMTRLTQVRAHPGVAERLGADVLAIVDQATGLDRVRSGLDDCGQPCLVHGDVWEGNMVVRRSDPEWRIAALLDPDLQYAPAELELAYLEVFDNNRPDFFSAYEQQHPRRSGYERRRRFYWLHTALLHVALFEDEFFQQYTLRIAEEIIDGS